MSLEIPEIKEMMQAGMHFGHRTAKWNPKMAKFIFGVKNGVHIFDLEKAREYLSTALEAVIETVASGGTILFLGTKQQAKKVIVKYAEEAMMPYVSFRWIGGTVTNHYEIFKLVKKMEELEKKMADPDYAEKYTKKERALFDEEHENLMAVVGGIRTMKKVPDIIFIASVRDEKTAVREAIAKKVKTIGITDSNTDPDLVTYPIPGNDDAIKSIEFVTKLVALAVKEGKEKQEKTVSAASTAKTEEKRKNQK